MSECRVTLENGLYFHEYCNQSREISLNLQTYYHNNDGKRANPVEKGRVCCLEANIRFLNRQTCTFLRFYHRRLHFQSLKVPEMESLADFTKIYVVFDFF